MSLEMLIETIAILVGLFSVVVMSIAIFLYVEKLSPRTFHYPLAAKVLIMVWSFVAMVNFVGGYLNVTWSKFGLDLLLDTIAYAQGIFLALWVLSEHLRLNALFGSYDDILYAYMSYRKI